ncbi:hypothetical protein CURTO8I2_280162 [Curtobacterium sp. 8I-2]|nr:hypothetical protein CURTO8I2_280162 [Curtobacterium sp. 8I-2]
MRSVTATESRMPSLSIWFFSSTARPHSVWSVGSEKEGTNTTYSCVCVSAYRSCTACSTRACCGAVSASASSRTYVPPRSTGAVAWAVAAGARTISIATRAAVTRLHSRVVPLCPLDPSVSDPCWTARIRPPSVAGRYPVAPPRTAPRGRCRPESIQATQGHRQTLGERSGGCFLWTSCPPYRGMLAPLFEDERKGKNDGTHHEHRGRPARGRLPPGVDSGDGRDRFRARARRPLRGPARTGSPGDPLRGSVQHHERRAHRADARLIRSGPGHTTDGRCPGR